MKRDVGFSIRLDYVLYLTALLAAAKIANLIAWSWWLIFLPAMVGFGFSFLWLVMVLWLMSLGMGTLRVTRKRKGR